MFWLARQLLLTRCGRCSPQPKIMKLRLITVLGLMVLSLLLTLNAAADSLLLGTPIFSDTSTTNAFRIGTDMPAEAQGFSLDSSLFVTHIDTQVFGLLPGSTQDITFNLELWSGDLTNGPSGAALLSTSAAFTCCDLSVQTVSLNVNQTLTGGTEYFVVIHSTSDPFAEDGLAWAYDQPAPNPLTSFGSFGDNSLFDGSDDGFGGLIWSASTNVPPTPVQIYGDAPAPPGTVPEPASLVFVGTGLAAVSTLVRKRVRKS